MIIAIVAILIFGVIPITGIITSHFQSQSKIKANMLKDELELEKLKHQNYLFETEKMKLELEKIKLDQPKDDIRF